MKHQASECDLDFQASFERCEFPVSGFDHRAHLKLAYIYLTESETEAACIAMRDALRRFLAYAGADPSKYHDTLTRAWMMAVRHFMEGSPVCDCADAFIDRNPILLDSKIMLSHYSAELLFSDEARAEFVAPDIEAIPEY